MIGEMIKRDSVLRNGILGDTLVVSCLMFDIFMVLYAMKMIVPYVMRTVSSIYNNTVDTTDDETVDDETVDGEIVAEVDEEDDEIALDAAENNVSSDTGEDTIHTVTPDSPAWREDHSRTMYSHEYPRMIKLPGRGPRRLTPDRYSSSDAEE